MRIPAILCAVIGLLGAPGAYAQDYPTRLIRMIVPGAPGGSADILARLIGTKLHERLGQPVVVEYRAGAAQMIGAEHLAKANRLRALAVTTGKRSEFLPELPTIAEAGVPGFDASTWWGLFAQGKTPREIVSRLNGELQKIVVADDVKARLSAEGAQAVLGMTPDAFNTLVRNEIAMWRRIAKERNIKGES